MVRQSDLGGFPHEELPLMVSRLEEPLRSCGSPDKSASGVELSVEVSSVVDA